MTADSPLFSLFGRSPVKPMQEHILKAHACVEQLVPFFKAVYDKDWQAAEVVRKDIIDFEHEADAIKKDIRLHLPNSLFMPVPRSDLLELLTMQDRLANRAKDISGIMLGREMEIPVQIQNTMKSYLLAAIATSVQAVKVIKELDELFETGFGSKEVQLVSSMLNSLDDAEHHTDELEITTRRELRDIEKTLNPIDAMFLYRVVESIGDLADVAQRVGSRLQILLAR